MVASILPLHLTGLEVHRRGKRLLGPVSMTLKGDGTTVIIGPNGSGKTTFLRALHGLERCTHDAAKWQADEETVRARQAFVFQSPIMMRRSVQDCIAYPLILAGQGKTNARAAAAEWAERVGLSAALTRPAHVLSGGEKQKLALARALIRQPELLFLDEPCANLDGRSTREIEVILADARQSGTRVVMSTHDMGQARRLADDVIFLYGGLIHEAGPKDAFFSAPKTPETRAFLNGDLLP
ncbi:ATP-binding cassette domain-containing protein [Actibacterium lipolyticum]|uniref:L-cystine import ATP-binding protein TcyC n=1 Tax=Actibacterium lipolyticum TaxID=1524263 RepID=A0A238KNZ7_9RHOB|nr:ATP-binding cassette domain-containing protein [Actibacterium lipolyticum]SMX44367.1 L-cystine import ATP-binding protein TcyC [Actibacterium lipolyticum]